MTQTTPKKIRPSSKQKRNRMNIFRLWNPTQLLTHGQWWSIFKTHFLQAEQWWHRQGLKLWQIRQYFLCYDSLFQFEIPQQKGTRPGSVKAVASSAHITIAKSTKKTMYSAMEALGSRNQQKNTRDKAETMRMVPMKLSPQESLLLQVRHAIFEYYQPIRGRQNIQKMSQFSESFASTLNKPVKTKSQYSRNVKKLKIKLKAIQNQIGSLEKKVKAYSDTSNDKMIAMKIAKFCKERRMTPEMLFRFADKSQKKEISKQDFIETAQIVGLKLTKHELTRFEYLLDEDLSGSISWLEYNGYLHAFGIKAEYSADDQFMKETLKKFDLNKILAIADENKIKEKDPPKKKRQLLNYQEFLKYCHRHLPELKDKEIASIFNRLERNGLIDLDDFIDYMKRKEEQRKRLEEKNKRRGGQKKQDGGKGEVEENQTKTLRGIIKALLRNRPKDSKSSFHSSQFQRLERATGKNKGELMQLFRQIDKRKQGSFGYNELINYYIYKESKGYLSYTYELMGKKITAMGHKPQDIINQYNGNRNKIDRTQFVKFMGQEFGTIEADSTAVFALIAKEEKVTTVRQIIDAMKLEEGHKKIVYIKPTLWKTHGKDFFKKGHLTILFNPFVALRFCLSIMEELNKSKQTHWDDFQFGPTFEDPFGSFSLGREMPSENVKWNSVTALGMNEFYYPTATSKKYASTVLCPHQMFCKSLSLLVNESDNYLWHRGKINYNIKEVKSEDLAPLFHGVYPLAFHSFAQFGIYVFKFFVQNKWIYVLVDNKIPCNSENQPMFSASPERRHSWISLIEKAYSKVKGSYQKMFEVHSNSQYLFEMTRKLPIQIQLPKQYINQHPKNEVWKYLQELQSNKENQLYSLTSEANAHNLRQQNAETGLLKNMLYQLQENVQLPDDSSVNLHKSHRILLFKELNLKNQNTWNSKWCSGGQEKNKYQTFKNQIEEKLSKKQGSVKSLKEKNLTLMNFKLFRNLFDKIFVIKQVSYEKMVILRKVVEFQEKHICRYELSAKEENNRKVSMVIALSRLKSPAKTVIEIVLKNGKGEVVQQDRVKGPFGCSQLTFDSNLHSLQIKVKDWESGQDHAYSLTFYMESPRYHLKELDRQLLFDFVSPLDECQKLTMKETEEKQRLFLYRNFYKGAERGIGCCG